MIPQEVIKLIEAVRGLGLEIVEKNGGETVRVKGGASEFPALLVELQKALIAFDESGANSQVSAVESEGGKEAEVYLYNLSKALIHKIKKGQKDSKSAAEIVTDAIEKYAETNWSSLPSDHSLSMKETPLAKGLQDENLLSEKSQQGLSAALSATNSFKQRAMARAQETLRRRAEMIEEIEQEQEAPVAFQSR